MKNLKDEISSGIIKPISKLAKNKQNGRSDYWKFKASKAWGKYIHTKYNSCMVCGKSSGKLDAHHLIPKGRNSYLKFNPQNGVLLCVHHHKWNRELSAHATPGKFDEYLEEKHPEKWDWVIKHRRDSGKLNFEECYNYLMRKIELLKEKI